MKLYAWGLVLIAILCGAVALMAGQATTFHTFQMSPHEVGVNCVNGGHPVVAWYGNNLVGVNCTVNR